MYELAINDCAQPVIGFYNEQEEFELVHTLESATSIVTGMVILKSFNDAHERGYELGRKHCEVTHELGGGHWLDDHRKAYEGGV